MRGGQGCLLPVVRCHHQEILLEEDKAYPLSWLLPKTCRADVSSHIPETPPRHSLPSPTEKRKKARRAKVNSPPASPSEETFSLAEEVNIIKDVSAYFLVEYGAGNPQMGSADERKDCLPQRVLNPEGPEGSFAKIEAALAEKTMDADGAYKVDHCLHMGATIVGGNTLCYKCNLADHDSVSVCDSHSNQEKVDQNEDNSYLESLDDETALRCLAFVSRSVYWKMALLNHRYMKLLRSSTLFDLRRRYGIVEQWICIFTSGSAGWIAFDPKQNVWRNLKHAAVNPNFDMSDRESLSAGTHLLWLGREAFDFACYKYDFVFNAWEKGSVMVNPRCLFASASCGEFAYVAGGFTVGGLQFDVLSSAERYDSRTGTWHELPPMTTPRQKCSGVVMDGKFYVIGGKDKEHQPVTSGEEFDIARGTWRTIENMYLPPPVVQSFEPSPPLVAVANNELYAIESSTNLLKHFQKGSNTWKVLGPVPVRADFCNGWGLAFKALGDELFVVGGHRTSAVDRERVAVFSWKPRPDALAPDWQLVNSLSTGTGTFLYNCAVMAC